jgi:hypothetical protein
MVADGVTRRACVAGNCGNAAENIGWVFKPNTVYVQAAGTVEIGIPNAAGIFSYPLAAGFSASPGFYIHGLNPDWTTAPVCIGGGGNYSGTMSTGSVNGGQANDMTSHYSGSVPCTSGTNYLLCVEQ